MTSSKLLLTAASLVVAASDKTQAAILWQQDFDSSLLVSDYVGTGTNQLDAASSAGPGLSWSIVDGTLQGTRTNNNGSLTINGDDYSSPAPSR